VRTADGQRHGIRPEVFLRVVIGSQPTRSARRLDT
jgi:hypothetical protein